MPKKDPDWGAIAAYMIDRRTHLGWTQEYAAKKADLSKDTWNALERERKKGVKAITLVNIARALGEEPREFLAIAKISGLNGRPDD